MIWLWILWLLLWWLLWYGVAYARFWDAWVVSELREQYKTLLHENESIAHDSQEHAEQNRILKYKAQQLLQQNEDYAKIVSQLNRYQYHLKDAFAKVQELNEILNIHDDDLEKRLLTMDTSWPWFDRSVFEEKIEPAIQEKKFF